MHHTPRISVSVRLRDFGGPWSIQENTLYHELKSARLEFSCYDRVLISSNKVIYDECVSHFLKNSDHQNVTVFAYGQTGSGKTYTMFGTKNDPGIVQRCLFDMFQAVSEVDLSFMEIYNDKISDLLANPECADLIQRREVLKADDEILQELREIKISIGVQSPQTKSQYTGNVLKGNEKNSQRSFETENSFNYNSGHNSTRLSPKIQSSPQKHGLQSENQNQFSTMVKNQIHREDKKSTSNPGSHMSEHADKKPSIVSGSKEIRVFSTANNTSASNLSMAHAKSAEFALLLIKTAQKHRKTASTRSNAASSRSHAILQIKSKKRCLTLIDLAGSEKAGNDLQRNKEGAHINKSLLSLSRAIGALGRNERPAFRESKLTRILQPSLSGKAAVVAVCAVSPEKECTSESLATLRFAAGLSAVRLKERVVERECDCKCCQKLKALQKTIDQQNLHPKNEISIHAPENISHDGESHRSSSKKQEGHQNNSIFSNRNNNISKDDKSHQSSNKKQDICDSGQIFLDTINDIPKEDVSRQNSSEEHHFHNSGQISSETINDISKEDELHENPSKKHNIDSRTDLNQNPKTKSYQSSTSKLSQKNSNTKKQNTTTLTKDESNTEQTHLSDKTKTNTISDKSKNYHDEKTLKQKFESDKLVSNAESGINSNKQHRDNAKTTFRKNNMQNTIDFYEIARREELINAYKEIEDIKQENERMRKENILFLERIKSLEETIANLMSQNPSKRINDLYVLEKNMFKLQLEMIRRSK